MIQARYIEKFRDRSGKIIGYRIQAPDGSVTDILADVVKDMIRKKELDVINLTLTSDGRLIDASSKQDSSGAISIGKCGHVDDKMIENILQDARDQGFTIKTVPSCKGKNSFIVIKPDGYQILIPSDIIDIVGKATNGVSLVNEIRRLSNLERSVEVIGGSEVMSVQGMFEHTYFKSIDLTKFDTSRVKIMKYMFRNCICPDINLSKLNTYQVMDMIGAFKGCKTSSLDLRSFKVPYVISTEQMFMDCECIYIDLSSFGENMIGFMADMFNGCKAQSINLSGLYTGYAEDTKRMFRNCETDVLDLTSFITRKVINMAQMFYGCKTRKLIIDSFETFELIDASEMFYGANIPYIDISNFKYNKLKQIENMFGECNSPIIKLPSKEFVKISHNNTVFKGCKAKININGEEYTPIKLECYRIGRETNIDDKVRVNRNKNKNINSILDSWFIQA